MSRQRFALPHPSPILLLSLLVLSLPVTWAQSTLLAKQTSIQPANYAVPFAAVPDAQTHLLPFPDTMPLSFTPNQGQTGPGLGFISRGAGYDPLLPTNKPVVELGAKANYWIAPPRWLTNIPDSVHHRIRKNETAPHDVDIHISPGNADPKLHNIRWQVLCAAWQPLYVLDLELAHGLGSAMSQRHFPHRPSAEAALWAAL